MKPKIHLVSLLATFYGLLLPLQPASAEFASVLPPTETTPSNYIEPLSDPFGTDYSLPAWNDDQVDVVPTADFRIYTNVLGLPPENAGTVGTAMMFAANASFDEDRGKLEYRWDFDNDGKFESYFSRSSSTRYTYKDPGVYEVKLEVLDQGGNIATKTKKVTIVRNTPPVAVFLYAPETGTPGRVFRFDTSLSFDNQYAKSSLQYRFDWNGDGKWDTNFEQKTLWQHHFEQSGNQVVTMQAKDPGGQRAVFAGIIPVAANTPPVALFTVKQRVTGTGTYYEFDASQSHDQETPFNRLRFRWDFQYSGPEDIMSDGNFSSSKRSFSYSLPGKKVIRLEVEDEDGAITDAYVSLEVGMSQLVAR